MDGVVAADGAAPRMSLGMKITYGLFLVLLAVAMWGLVTLFAYYYPPPLARPWPFLLSLLLQLAKCAALAFACHGIWTRKPHGQWLGAALIAVMGVAFVGHAVLEIYRSVMGLPPPADPMPYKNEAERAGGLFGAVIVLALGPWLFWKWTGVFVRSERSRQYFRQAKPTPET